MSRISQGLDAATGQPSGPAGRPGARGVVDVMVMGLCAVVVGLVFGAGISAITASDASVVGKVEGGGWGGRGCYPTVSYTVEDLDYLLRADKDPRWCGLHMLGPARVYYEPDDPAQARLARYGDLPWLLVRIALALGVVAAFLSTRRRTNARPTASRSGRAASLRGHQGRVPRILVLLLILGWLATTIASVVLGERRSSLDDLQAAIDRGDVTQVWERGAVMSGRRGASTVRLVWTSGGLRHFATATHYRGSRAEHRAPKGANDVILGDLAENLSQGGAEVRVRPDLRTRSPSSFAYTPWGWHCFGWPVYSSLALLLATLRVLFVADDTRGASRWGWFWLVVAAPIPLALAYLAVGGPAGWGSATHREAQRLGGLGAFLLATALTAMQRALV